MIIEVILDTPDAEGPVVRPATYAFRKSEDELWLCDFDDASGTNLLDA